MKSIKELREQRKLSQLQLAEKIGVDRSTIAKWETSDTCPSGQKLPEIADVLGCTIDALYGREPEIKDAS